MFNQKSMLNQLSSAPWRYNALILSLPHCAAINNMLKCMLSHSLTAYYIFIILTKLLYGFENKQIKLNAIFLYILMQEKIHKYFYNRRSTKVLEAAMYKQLDLSRKIV